MTDDRRRRVDDDRIEDLVEKVEEIRDMLISEPEASPLGRALLKTSQTNRRLIDDHHTEFKTFIKEEFKPLNDWWNQSKGAWKFILGFAAVMGIVGAFFGILSFFGLGR